LNKQFEILKASIPGLLGTFKLVFVDSEYKFLHVCHILGLFGSKFSLQILGWMQNYTRIKFLSHALKNFEKRGAYHQPSGSKMASVF
jgi:hypothetical protein